MPILDKKSNQQFIPYLAPGVGIFASSGSPEGVQAGGIGSEYTDLVNGNKYVKTTVFDILTGWVLQGGGGGTGTVTSVDFTAPSSVFSVSGNPITTSGTIALAFQTQLANKVFAGPTSGGAATPTFRSLVSGDIPILVPGISKAILFDNGGGLIAGVAGILVDDTTYSAIVGKTADQTGNLIIRAFNGNQTTLTVNAPAANNILKFPDAVGTVNQVLGILSVSSGTIQTSWQTVSGGASFANPSALVGLTTVNGSATTAMRSDGAPPLSQAINPTWTQQHVWQVSNAAAVSIGPNGDTNPVWRVVTNVVSQATGISVTGNAAGTAPNISTLSSGSNEGLQFTPKGTGNIIFGDASQATITLASNLSGANDSLITLGNALINFDPANVGFTQRFSNSAVIYGASIQCGWGSGNTGQTSNDTALNRATSLVIGLTNGSTSGATFRAVATTPAQITGDQNNYNPGGSSYFQRWSTDASRQITGLTFTAAQVDGQVHEMWNAGSNDIVLVHQSASSTAANRFSNSSAANYTVTSGQGARFTYDGTTLRWRVTLLT